MFISIFLSLFCLLLFIFMFSASVAYILVNKAVYISGPTSKGKNRLIITRAVRHLACDCDFWK